MILQEMHVPPSNRLPSNRDAPNREPPVEHAKQVASKVSIAKFTVDETDLERRQRCARFKGASKIKRGGSGKGILWAVDVPPGNCLPSKRDAPNPALPRAIDFLPGNGLPFRCSPPLSGHLTPPLSPMLPAGCRLSLKKGAPNPALAVDHAKPVVSTSIANFTVDETELERRRWRASRFGIAAAATIFDS